MVSITDSSVTIQTSPQSVPSTPSWFGEVALIAHYLRRIGVLSAMEGRVRFARRRFGHYEVVDFVAVLLGYAISGERTLEAFYERLSPFANAFMALFGRDRLPARSTLSRFLAAATIKPLSRRCARCFSKTCWPALWRRTRKRVGCGTDGEHTTWCSMWMARGKPPENLPCLAHLTSHPPDVGWTRSVLLAIWGASGAKWCACARPFCKHTRTSGWAPSPEHLGQATATIAESWGRP